MNIQTKLLATVIAAATLVGCGTEEQDSGISGRSGDSSNAIVKDAIVVDGPVARGTVFFDLNGNLKKDSFEPSALTDNNGYYNADVSRKISYCLTQDQLEDRGGWWFKLYSGYTSQLRPEYCLKLSSAQREGLNDDSKIIVTGGYDLYTGEPFEGSMSIPTKSVVASLTDGDNFIAQLLQSQVAITPLSSIVSNGSEDITTLAQLLDLTGAQNYLNPADPEGDGQADNFDDIKNKFAVTYQMHKYVTIVADWVKDRYPEIGEDDKLPNDISSLIYKQFENLTAGTTEKYNEAWAAIFADMTKLYTDAEVTLPAPATPAQIVDLAAKLLFINTAVINAFGNTGTSEITGGNLGSDLTFDNVKARVRGVEVVVSKMLQGSNYTNAIAALLDPTYLENLKGNSSDGDNLNFTQLVEFDGIDFAAASAIAKDTAGSSLSSDLAGKSLEFSTNKVGLESSAAIFFTGEEGATKGSIHLCLTYLDDDKPNDRLDGEYISGNWETIAALNNTVMLGLNYVGYRTAVLKKIGTIGNSTDYRFEFADEITKFNSDDDLEDTAENVVIPTSNQTCKAHLDNIAAQEQELL